MVGMRWFQTTWTMRLPDAATEKLRRPRSSPRDASVQRDHGLDEAQRLFAQGLRCLGLEREELPGLAQGGAGGAHAHADRGPNARIAGQLQLGQVSRATHCARTAPPELLGKLDQALGK